MREDEEYFIRCELFLHGHGSDSALTSAFADSCQHAPVHRRLLHLVSGGETFNVLTDALSKQRLVLAACDSEFAPSALDSSALTDTSRASEISVSFTQSQAIMQN